MKLMAETNDWVRGDLTGLAEYEDAASRWHLLRVRPNAICPDLGKITGLVMNALSGYDAAMNDPITVAYGMGSEMSGLFWRSARARALAVLKENCLTPQEFEEELRLRVDAKWLWESGLLGIAQELEED